MTAIQIQTLLEPPNASLSSERALSQLNGYFTTFDDLRAGDQLAHLLETSRTITENLDVKLSQSQKNIDHVIEHTRSEAQSHLNSARELSLLRHALTDELTSLSGDLVSFMDGGDGHPTLLEEIETMHRSLKELESINSYVGVVEKALKLSKLAVEEIQTLSDTVSINEVTLTKYAELQTFVSSVKTACEGAEDGTGQGLKIVSFLESVRVKSWSEIRDLLSSVLLTTAETLHWPLAVEYTAVPPDDRRRFEKAFFDLLALQDVGKKLHQSSIENDNLDKAGLYPLQALVKPIALRFKYHFDGTRQTNRLDKPEWYFAHILNVSHEQRPFMNNVIQTFLQTTPFKHINAWREFTRLLLPILSRKLRLSVPPLLPHPSLLAHTIYQSLAFDNALREAGFGLVATMAQSSDTTAGEDEWRGTSDMILGNQEWFDTWVDGEKRFAEDQYNEAISSSDAWQIVEDDDHLSETEVRPTKSARRIKALIEQITDRYRPLPRFSHRTKFLITVQVPILEFYHTRITDSLNAFETLSSFLVRAVPGALAVQGNAGQDTKRMTSGIEGVQRLIKAFLSAKWITSAMETWGEDLFFLELWETICEKSRLRRQANDHPSLPDPDQDKDEGTIFDELIGQYTKVCDRVEGMVVRQIFGEVEVDLRSHLYRKSDDRVPSSPLEDPAISSTLMTPLARLSGHLTYLQKVLPQAMVLTLYRRIASQIAEYILQRSIMYQGRAHISARDGKLAFEECNLWLATSRMALSRGVRRIEGPWQKLFDTTKILSLEGNVFLPLVNAAFLGSEQSLQDMMEELGIVELRREDIVAVIRLRQDCPR